jgi:hypothetical protein
MRFPWRLLRETSAAKTKSPLALLRQRAEECLISEALSTPQRARRMAVMMPMCVVDNNHELTE